MTGHHLVLGKITDFITGKEIEDNHDERYRQKIAKLLVHEKGYKKSDIIKNRIIKINVNDFTADIPVDFSIIIESQILMIIKYGPGSIVSREKPAIACARLITDHEVPLCVVTNGEDAELMDVKSGKVVSKGLDSIPEKKELLKVKIKRSPDNDMIEKAQKILFAFDVNDRCPCDNTICIKKSE